jgi:preprotein translocase SecE subunit
VAKTRAQRKAEARRRAQLQQGRTDADLTEESRAQHDTQVGETGYELEAELAERGVPLDELTGKVDETTEARPAADPAAPGREAEEAAGIGSEPVDKISRRAERQAEKERKAKAKESEQRRAPKVAAPAEKRQRGGVIGFFISCWAELKRVQWPDRETLIQASAITLVFITVMAAYLGVLDAVFNWLVQRII